jgi:ankyrin repeat protein
MSKMLIMVKKKFSRLRNRRCLSLRKLTRWADHELPQEVGITPLHRAAWEGDSQKVTELLSSGVDPNIQDRDGYVPLHDAALQGHVEIVSILLQAGALVDIQDKDFQYTPLHDAARYGYNKVLTVLLNAGARIDLRDIEGLTPQECAEKYGQYAAAQVLAKHKV